MAKLDYIESETIAGFLKRVLESRQKKNPRYSLRGFAKQLDISPSFLSELLKGKKD